MKILHVNYSDGDGGAAIAVKRLHNILNQKKIDSYLLVSEKKYNDLLKPASHLFPFVLTFPLAVIVDPVVTKSI